MLAAMAAAIASSATAQNVTVQHPVWLHRPTAQDLISVWPRDALRKGRGGKALITCVVTVVGALRDCIVANEDPQGAGFGLAAIALTPQFQFRPATVGGKPVESKVNIPIDFQTHEPVAIDNHAALTGTRMPVAHLNVGKNITQVTWMAAPAYADVSAAYPAKAREAHVGGLVTLSCKFGLQGNLSDCDVARETPTGLGFGRAAKGLAKAFMGPTNDPTGASVAGATTQIVMAFSPDMLIGAQPAIGKPTWTHLPEALDVAESFPAAATTAHVGVGHVVLACDVGPGGHLANCAVERQSPEGLGFGAAALALSAQFQVSVWTDEGLPTIGGRVDVPIRYEAAPPPAPSAKP